MFSAVKFIAAAAIVALFGGFLLAGILSTQPSDETTPAVVTESPSPMTSEELLSGMVTEEVEPGVYEVVDDGAGHVPGAIEGEHVMPRSLDRLHIEPDGSIWVMTTVYGDDWGKDDDDAVAWEVGVEGRHSQGDGFPGHEYPNRMPSDLTFATAPDGTLWAAGGWGLASFDGEAWTPHGEDIWANTVSVLPDGTVWAAWPDRIGRLGPDGWQWFDTSDGVPIEVYQFSTSPDGRVFAVGSGRLVGFDGSAWRDIQPLGSGADTKVIGLRVAPDGTLWALLSDVTWSHDRVEPWLVRGLATDLAKAQQHYLARFDGDTWMVYSRGDGVPRVSGSDNTPNWEVHPDGSVWVLDGMGALLSFDGTEWTERTKAAEQFSVGPDRSVWAIAPDGVASFDGDVWTRYERPIGSDALDVAPDGTAWLVSNEDGHGLYVITPEAAGAMEAAVSEPPPVKEPTDPQEVVTTAIDLLSDMVTEEVEPGVLRVLDDGAGHAIDQMPAGEYERMLYVGPEGAVWVANDAVAWQLGVPGSHQRSPDGYPGGPAFDTAPDGTLWNAAYSHFASYDGDSWTVYDPRERPTGGPDPGYYVDVLPDGTAWVSWHNGSGRVYGEGWEPFSVEDGAPAWGHDVWSVPDGEVYAVGGPLHGSGHRLVRLEDSEWHEVPLPDIGAVTRVTSVRPGPDGDLWVHFISRHFPDGAPRDYEGWWVGGERPDDHLARYDGESWTVYSGVDGVPVLSPAFQGLGPMWDVHPDGTAWMLSSPKPTACPDPDPGDRCNLWSLVSFDGDTWVTHADDVDGWFQVGPDGTVWTNRPDLVHGLSDGHLASLDGTAWRHYPEVAFETSWFDRMAEPDNLADGFDFGPDGSAWVLAASTDGETDDLYVITPEAVGATE